MLEEFTRCVTTALDAVRGIVRKIEEVRAEGRLGELADEGRRRIMNQFHNGGSHHETEDHDQDRR
jgi:hypothetical protein